MQHLKLIAFDQTDLTVISAHLQNSHLKTADMAYLPRARRFVVILNRLDWSQVINGDGEERRRSQCALRFERVLRAQFAGFDPAAGEEAHALLAIAFEGGSADDPAGTLTLYFAGGGAVRLDVECIEAELRDLVSSVAGAREPVPSRG